MNIEPHRGMPTYPSAAQFAVSAKLLGIAAVASLGVSAVDAAEAGSEPVKPQASTTANKEKKPKTIHFHGEMDEGIHDYLYPPSNDETMRTLVARIYQDGMVVEKADEIGNEKVHEGGREIMPFNHLELLYRRIAAANPSLKLASWDEPIPTAKMLLLPQVYKKTKTIKTGNDRDYGVHDYQYVTKEGETLKAIVARFYGSGTMDEKPDGSNGKYIPFDSAVFCKKVVAANPSIQLDTEKPLPPDTKLLLPRVLRQECGH